MILRALAAVLAVTFLGGGYLYWSHRQGVADAAKGWASIQGAAELPVASFDPAMVSGLPEVAQRYFLHAISPGTPLKTTVELRLKGLFLMGEKANPKLYEMEARQILSPPSQFVWVPTLRSGGMTVSGSDALVDGTAWTRFWVQSLLPVVDTGSSEDLVRSAQFRAAIEAIWAPASLLLRDGISWRQAGRDKAGVTVVTAGEAISFELTLDASGAVTELWGMRWSDANPEHVFRLQPFGGTISREATFAGYTIPSMVRVGNMFGTDEYMPFYQAEVVEARYP